ncbi:MAG: tRNA (adenosine(37)-N6)-threonylcarbamoyltransferase complex transferase subunit TsaD [Simkaniaceae bacterium]|nr:tRNA (adenosine(37)-N6)-threonylcarbamoyltransferase complex transferase subunit TsaD [Candidatus Sacchlamyda saccharinae]
MITLGIESTCDEMAVAVVKDGIEILSNVIASQSDYHKKFGGVYPEMAARQHVDLLIPTIQEALELAGEEPDLIAVAMGPGLIGPLMIGLNAAKTLSLAWNKPFLGVNHVEAHLYAAMMSNRSFVFPALGVVVSGGHTFLVKILDVGRYEMIGTTVDDAIGEAFDKVAALLDLPYPGGPEVEELARNGDASRFPYKAGKVKGSPWNFSFSGLKTNVLYTVKGQNGDKRGKSAISEEDKPDVAASFQEVALRDVVDKALRAAKEFDCQAIYVGGGVSHNRRLRELLDRELPVYFPGEGLSLDNAAMIAGLGTKLYAGKGDPLDLEPFSRLNDAWFRKS